MMSALLIKAGKIQLTPDCIDKFLRYALGLALSNLISEDDWKYLACLLAFKISKQS